MNVIEIFDSIDGEGIRAGELATFIRLAGCNLRCSYCDTAYALEANAGKEMSVEDVVSECDKLHNKNITLTGGEPLINKRSKTLIDALLEREYIVNIETNGSVLISPYIVSNVIVTLDYKTPSSGECSKMLLENISALRENDVLKIVMQESDFGNVKELLWSYKPKSYIYLSPVFGKVEPAKLVDFMKECRNIGIDTSKMRVQLQLHKFIWKPDERGV